MRLVTPSCFAHWSSTCGTCKFEQECRGRTLDTRSKMVVEMRPHFVLNRAAKNQHPIYIEVTGQEARIRFPFPTLQVDASIYPLKGQEPRYVHQYLWRTLHTRYFLSRRKSRTGKRWFALYHFPYDLCPDTREVTDAVTLYFHCHRHEEYGTADKALIHKEMMDSLFLLDATAGLIQRATTEKIVFRENVNISFGEDKEPSLRGVNVVRDPFAQASLVAAIHPSTGRGVEFTWEGFEVFDAAHPNQPYKRRGRWDRQSR